MRILLALALLSTSLLAQEQTVTGILIDNACRLEGMTRGSLVKHDKGCLQMGECAKSGYAIWTDDDKIFVLDAKSNVLARAEIRKASRQTNLRVSATGISKGEAFVASALTVEK
jgi:hypothetical protein